MNDERSPDDRPPDVGRLAGVVRGEALRADAESRIRPDPELVGQGWQWRFALEQARAGDLVRLYEDAGFEVLLSPIRPEQLEDQCADCRLVAVLQYVALYTRRTGTDSGKR